MPKKKDQQPKNEREKKKGFWSSFFEPVPADEEYDPASANRQYGEPPEPPLKHLFGEDDLEFSEEEDAANIARLTWDDGENVVSDTARMRYRPREEAAPREEPRAPRQ